MIKQTKEVQMQTNGCVKLLAVNQNSDAEWRNASRLSHTSFFWKRKRKQQNK